MNRVEDIPSRHAATPLVVLTLIGIAVSNVVPSRQSMAEMGVAPSEDKQATEQLTKAHRSVIGTVVQIAADQLKVDIGEVQPRFLPLKSALKKSFAPINEGDQLIITLNDQNLIVDFHPLTGGNQDPIANHKIIRGEIAQALITGNAAVVIRAGGKEQLFPISPQVRSKVASIPVGHSAIFLIDEIDQVADVTFKSPDSAKSSPEQDRSISAALNPPERMSGKGMNPHEQVSGTVVMPLTDSQSKITVRTEGGTEKTFEVRELPQKKMGNLSKGDMVVLLIDGDKKVIDVAIPPREHYR
jgi:hypothetical protein